MCPKMPVNVNAYSVLRERKRRTTCPEAPFSKDKVNSEK